MQKAEADKLLFATAEARAALKRASDDMGSLASSLGSDYEGEHHSPRLAAFHELKSALADATDAACGLTCELIAALGAAQGLVDERFGTMLSEWEERMALERAAKEGARREVAAAEGEWRCGQADSGAIEQRKVAFRNALDPRSLVPRPLRGFSETATGIAFDDANAVRKLTRGGVSAAAA